jgi:hypothetical protein
LRKLEQQPAAAAPDLQELAKEVAKLLPVSGDSRRAHEDQTRDEAEKEKTTQQPAGSHIVGAVGLYADAICWFKGSMSKGSRRQMEFPIAGAFTVSPEPSTNPVRLRRVAGGPLWVLHSSEDKKSVLVPEPGSATAAQAALCFDLPAGYPNEHGVYKFTRDAICRFSESGDIVLVTKGCIVRE